MPCKRPFIDVPIHLLSRPLGEPVSLWPSLKLGIILGRYSQQNISESDMCHFWNVLEGSTGFLYTLHPTVVTTEAYMRRKPHRPWLLYNNNE